MQSFRSKDKGIYVVLIALAGAGCSRSKVSQDFSNQQECHFRGDPWLWSGTKCIRKRAGNLSKDECLGIIGAEWHQEDLLCKRPDSSEGCRKVSDTLVWNGEGCIERAEENFLAYCRRKGELSREEQHTLDALGAVFASEEKKFCEKIFHNLKKSWSLKIEGMKLQSLKALKFFPQLRSLQLNNNTISSLNYLHELLLLESLSLANNQIADIGVLAKLKRLRRLVLSGNNITDLKPLSGLSELVLLDVSGNPGLKNLQPLEGKVFNEGFYY